MGYTPLLRGRVQGLARGIDVPNATPDASGLASVNPIFTFVRLAQRVPVRIHIDEVPDDVKLVAGMTATVQIEPYKAPPISGLKPASGKVSQADVQPASFQTLTDAAPQTAPAGSGQTGDDNAGSARAIRQSASDAGGSVSMPLRSRLRQRSSKRTPRNRRRRLPLPTSCRCPSRPRRRPPLRRMRPPPISRRSNSRSPPIPPVRRRLRQERRRNAVKRISGADLRPFRRSKRDARAEAAVSRHDPQARPLQVATFAASAIAVNIRPRGSSCCYSARVG